MAANSPDGTFRADCAGFLVRLSGLRPAAAEVRTNGFHAAHAAGAQQAAKNRAAKARCVLTQALSLGFDESW